MPLKSSFMLIEPAVPSAKGPVQVQRGRKKSGAGKSTKKLLKQLRKIAEVAHNEGLL